MNRSFSLNGLFPVKGVGIIRRNDVGLIINEHSFYPLYIYPTTNSEQTSDQHTERATNLDQDIVNEIAASLGLEFITDASTPLSNQVGNLCFINNNDELRDEFKQTFAPIDLLDYIYAVLHSPSYVGKLNKSEIDSLRVPYPEDAETFWRLVKLGTQIREIYQLESPDTAKFLSLDLMAGQ